tara:strand:- start:448 stop:726 length:279 start_codon:yes stop_codon:yes gene_type:complete
MANKDKADMKHVAPRMDLQTKWTIEFLGQKRPYHNTTLSEFIRDAIAEKIKKEIYGDLNEHKVDWIPQIEEYIEDKKTAVCYKAKKKVKETP